MIISKCDRSAWGRLKRITSDFLPSTAPLILGDSYKYFSNEIKSPMLDSNKPQDRKRGKLVLRRRMLCHVLRIKILNNSQLSVELAQTSFRSPSFRSLNYFSHVYVHRYFVFLAIVVKLNYLTKQRLIICDMCNYFVTTWWQVSHKLKGLFQPFWLDISYKKPF